MSPHLRISRPLLPLVHWLSCADFSRKHKLARSMFLCAKRTQDQSTVELSTGMAFHCYHAVVTVF